MARRRKSAKLVGPGSKRVLVVLFVPSVERDGATPIDQQRWVEASLAMFATAFGGATATRVHAASGVTTKGATRWCGTTPW